MSVIVRGMKIPKSCSECPFLEVYNLPPYYDDEFECEITYQSMSYEEYKTRCVNCPLVEVQPHGRLIDADALIEDLERQCKEVFRIDAVSPDDYWITRNEAYNEALWKSWVESLGDYLKTRPTIIEAEE